MKKKILILNFMCLILFAMSCTNNVDEITEGNIEKKQANGSSVCAITGTFIDFWNKGYWTQQQWLNQFEEMKQIGINTVIIQAVSFDQYTWFNSNNTFATTKFNNALSRLLNAAVEKDLKVYIGLYFNSSYWQNQINVSWLHTHADRCKYIAAEIQNQFGNNPAFEGWYIPHEPEPYAYNTTALVTSFKVNFVNRISNYLNTLNNKPVAIAAFFNSALTTSNQLLYFMCELSKCNLQVIMLQDGIGVGHVSLNNLLTYYNDAVWGVFGENPNYTGEFWTDVETFTGLNPSLPANINTIISQLQIELSLPQITKAVSFQYYQDMCPTGPNGSTALALRNSYLNYIEGL